jgi:3-oxoacyl-[acyl-carrier-protein] synthase-1
MSAPASISILGFAGCSSLGYSLPATLAAMGAGLSNFTDTGLRTVFDTPIAAAALLDRELLRFERLSTLANIGLLELQSMLNAVGLTEVPLMVGVPSDLDDDEQAVLRAELEGSAIVRQPTAWFPHGRASTFGALASALELLERGSYPAIAVGGIDSLCSLHTIHRLVQFGRVLGPHTEGTIPGEAAVFALLVRSDDAAASRATAVGLETVAVHRSSVPFTERDRVSGDGLAAVLASFREQGARAVDRVIAAHSGEGYFGHSFAHAYLRELEVMPEPLDLELIADCVGDVGAAAGMLGLAFATYRMAAQPRRGHSRALVYSESDTGEVGAAIIEGRPTSRAFGAAA